jgi:hypothetical protein
MDDRIAVVSSRRCRSAIRQALSFPDGSIMPNCRMAESPRKAAELGHAA